VGAAAARVTGDAWRDRILPGMEAFNESWPGARDDEKSADVMGLLTLFSKASATLHRLPSGSFTVDREGTVIVGTLPSSFPTEVVRDISGQVLAAFREATDAQLPLSQLVIHYPTLTITAKELRGGAIIFLSPKHSGSSNANHR